MKKLILVLLFLFVSVTLTEAQSGSFHGLADKLMLTLEGNATYSATDYAKPEIGYLGAFSATYYFYDFSQHAFGIKLKGGYGIIKGFDDYPQQGASPNFETSLIQAGGGIVYSHNLSENLLPYVSVGASYLIFDPKDQVGNLLPGNNAGLYEKNCLVYSGELGFDYFVSNRVSIRLNAAVNMANDWLDDTKLNEQGDWYYSAGFGISYSFFGEDEKVVLLPTGIKGDPIDSDEDGVYDYMDMCPDTPLGAVVSKQGCSIDNDGDGVINDDDDCPDTLADVEVDENGCALDSDNDGVYDYLDECPDTEDGVEVDEAGCEVLVMKMETPFEEETYEEDINLETEYVVSRESMSGNLIFTDQNLFCFQVSSWKSKSLAEREVERLKRRGIDAVIHQMYIPQKGGTWFRVRVGYFATRDEANAYRAQNFSKIFLTNDKAYYQYKR